MSLTRQKAQKINIHSYFFSSFCNIIRLFFSCFFFLFVFIMCKFCATAGPPPWLVEHQNKNDFDGNQLTFIDYFFKIISHQMESKVKNSISQQAEQAAVLSEHSRVYGKKAWDIKNKNEKKKIKKKNPEIKDFLTALEQKHSSCTSSIRGLEFLADTFNKECRSGRRLISERVSTLSIKWASCRTATR